jgi:ferredoxin
VKVRVDRDKCMGHAVCAMNAPSLMRLDDLGYNITGTIDVAPQLEEEARRAAGSCPEAAIEIVETTS